MISKIHGKMITAAITAAVVLSGCSRSAPEKYASRQFFSMDTYMTAEAWGDNAETAVKGACDEILRLESLFSVTAEGSDISRINSARGEKTAVSGETAELIRYGINISARTGGAFDMTVYPLVREWGFTAGEYHVPPRERIAELLGYADFRQIRTDNNTVTVPEGFMLDGGALAKGFACDRAAEIMEKAGIDRGIINAGGNIRVIGEKPDGEPWRIAVTDPFSPEEELCVIDLYSGAAATSGDYRRYFTDENGIRYGHIIDPASGYPAESGLASATAVSASGALCDGLSTALFVMGKEQAENFWRENGYNGGNGDFEMLLVCRDGSVYITEGLADKVIFTDKQTEERVTVIWR